MNSLWLLSLFSNVARVIGECDPEWVFCENVEGHLDLQPEFFGLDEGLANRVERSRAAGNGVVPQVAAYAWRTLKAAFFEEK
ncbi:hypothetical protein [uncultured Roseibium sp.]|uniref:hypothetical protein n=1 Tax=uncultured Roseibium sp. TaxID=1936171 RepID=UPI0026234E77|nr:hypothetical protein [uncultured Roseibium sp.]